MFKWSLNKSQVLQQLERHRFSSCSLTVTRRRSFPTSQPGDVTVVPFSRLFDCRSPTCGRCTRNAAGISSLPEIASVNSTKTSWARADRPGCPRGGVQQPFRLKGRKKKHVRRNSDLSLCWSSTLFIYSRLIWTPS